MKLENKHLFSFHSGVRDALKQLDFLGTYAILIIVDENNVLKGSLTDGDLRRGFIKGLGFEDPIEKFIQSDPKFIYQDDYNTDILEEYKKKHFKIIPIVNREMEVVDVLNFHTRSTLLPLDAVLMAGGEGRRLRPLTENTPKPLLKVGDKPIIEYNIDRLAKVGVKNVYLSINYLGEQLEDYFSDGKDRDLNIQYIKEPKPLGTIGSVLLVDNFSHDEILIMNSDLLTNIDIADFYKSFKAADADMAVAATSYSVNIPYAVLETDGNHKVKSLKEKPRYNYFSSAGIYILKKDLLKMIPTETFFDITDLMDKVLSMNLNLITYPINGYWLDIGRHEDYNKAQEDIKHLKID